MLVNSLLPIACLTDPVPGGESLLEVSCWRALMRRLCNVHVDFHLLEGLAVGPQEKSN